MRARAEMPAPAQPQGQRPQVRQEAAPLAVESRLGVKIRRHTVEYDGESWEFIANLRKRRIASS